jgi:hypothetical protein
MTLASCYIDGRYRFAVSDRIGPMNLGNPHEVTVLELVQIVLELTDSSICMTFEPLPEDDPTMRCPDISLARRALGWQPTWPLRDGLAATIEWFRQHPDVAVRSRVPERLSHGCSGGSTRVRSATDSGGSWWQPKRACRKVRRPRGSSDSVASDSSPEASSMP